MGDPDGHCCEDEIDFGVGVLRGIASSVSFGYVGAPRPTDTAASVAGQLTGTGIVGSTGEFTKDAGAGTAVLGLAAEGPSLGTSTTVVAAGGLGVLAGTALEGGAATNAARIVLAPLQSTRVGDFSSGDKNRLDQQNASQNGGQNKCTECGQDVQKVQNQKGQSAPGNQLQRHHDPPLSKGGNSQSPKNRIVCKDCHIKIHKNPLNP